MAEERPSPEMILEYFYGLLEPAEAVRVRDWLESNEGAAARAEAERTKNLFATAATMTFPELKFERPTTMPARTPRRLRQSWMPWVVAATLLLVAAAPFGWHKVRERECMREMAVIQPRLDAKRAELRDLQEQRAARLRAADELVTNARTGLERQQSELSVVEQKLKDGLQKEQLSLVISGPATILPGAPNDFHIRALDGRNQPTNATVVARVKDTEKNQLYEQALGRRFGEFDLRLPLDLSLGRNDVVLEVDAISDAGSKSELHEQLPLALPQLLTHLTTDKPLYRPGETVRFRSLTLDRLSLKPPRDDLQLEFSVIDPDQVQRIIVRGPTRLVEGDSPVLGPDRKPVRGIGCGEWLIPDHAPDGDYTLSIRELNRRMPKVDRRFTVKRYRPERLIKELEWSRKSYGPGEPVIANCVVSSETGPVVRQPARATVTVDGETVPVESVPLTDEAGRIAIQFKLPDKIERGDAKLRVEFQNGAVHESLSRSIPIALKKLEIEFFPEGGDLIAGAPNRVYFQAHTALGKPADVEGRIVDRNGREVARAATLTGDQQSGVNQGMGRFEFTPESNQEYRLIVEKPQGIDGEFKLPQVLKSGVVLTTLDVVNPEPGPLRVRVTSVGAERKLLIGTYARGRMLDHRRIVVPASQSAEIDLRPESGFGGITRITVFEERPGESQQTLLVPVAERLVYRKPSAALNLSLTPDRPSYGPGESVRYKVTAADEAQKSASAILYFAVVNESVIAMADDKTDQSLPTYFLLTGEVLQPEDLENADVLLGNHPNAGAAIDLLLGVQGWRRFKEQLPSKPSGTIADADRVLLAASVASGDRAKGEGLGRENRRVTDEFRSQTEAVRRELTAAQAALGRLKADVADTVEEKRLDDEYSELNAQYRKAESDRLLLDETWRQFQSWILPVLCALGLALIPALAIIGRRRGWEWRIPAVASLTVAIAAVVMIAVNMRDLADQAPGDRAIADNAPTVEATPDWKPPAGRAGLAGAERSEPKSPLGAEAKSDVQIFRTAPSEPKSAAPPPPAPLAPAPATSPAPSPITPASPDKKSVKLDSDETGRKTKEIDFKNENATKELRKAAEAAPFGGGRGGSPRRTGDTDKLSKSVAKPDERLPGDAGGAKNPDVIPPPRGALSPGRPGGGPVAGEILKPRDDLDSTLRLTEPLVVRQYAHSRSERTRAGADFAETLFWHPVLVIPTTGAEVTFDLANEIVGYRVIAAGHTLDGRVGAIKARIDVRRPDRKEADKARDPAKP